MLIGRKKEKKELLDLLESTESQFCAVYGRRRVGKTYLIRETYNYTFTFQHTAIAKASIRRQLQAFRNSLLAAGYENCAVPQNWYDAFDLLARLIEKSQEAKKLIFIDELSWMDTPKSNFISALEHFWNGWVMARKEKDVVLVVCGSVTSWIINKIARNKDGLHNRLTSTICVQPFTLSECEQYANVMNLQFQRKDIVEAYMVFGGVPYYWSLLRTGESLVQNINRLFFAKQAKLRMEFEELFYSLFKKADPYIAIVKALTQKKSGLTKGELCSFAQLENGGTLFKQLEELEQSGFIIKTVAFGKKNYGSVYRLIDNFVLFHYRFLAQNNSSDEQYWTNIHPTMAYVTWAGLSFEGICFSHIPQIKKALGISGILSNVSSWRTEATDNHSGAQVDLLIDRADNVINLCEIKFSNAEYVIDDEENRKLQNRKSAFVMETKTKKTIFLTMISTYGVLHNAYWNEIQCELTMDDLFDN